MNYIRKLYEAETTLAHDIFIINLVFTASCIV